MKKLLSLTIAILIATSSQATLIHIRNIKNKGKNGYDKVLSYSGFLITIEKCKDPGLMTCPFECGALTTAPTPNKDLQAYEKDFILKAFEVANGSEDANGLYTMTFKLADGSTKVLTAKYEKGENSEFLFEVVENASYEANITELNSINPDDY